MAKKVENEIVKIDNPLNDASYTFSTDKIEKSNCKLCQSEFREKAEELYVNQKRKNYAEIKRKLKDEDDFEVSAVSVRNHIIYHYKAVENKISLQEYADDVQRWVSLQTNKVHSLRSRIAILERYMFVIAQESEDLDIIERRKSAEVVKKLADTILVYENKLKDFSEDAKPVVNIFNQLQVIVKDEIQHIESNKTKRVLNTVLDRLKDIIGEELIE